ncbi:MAG: polymorphic toxin type 23 domain-containing protein [Bacteroidota bacterium]|jgi:hypothetical protein
MRLLIIMFFLIVQKLCSQTYHAPHAGLTLGIQIAVGSHVNSFGISVNMYYSNYFFQCNAGSSLRFNLTSYGQRNRFIENRNHLGLILLAGHRGSLPNFQLDGLFHNTKFNYGLGYNYVWYLDNAGTSQRSGGWGLHVKEFSILLENDVFGGQSKDRFRTGQLTFMYRPMENINMHAGLYIWTGETANSRWERISMENCPSGFRCLDELPYGTTSHGIVYGGIQIGMPYGQVAGFRVGTDSEHFRHFFQNRLSHDLIFLPKKFKRNTPHYPRLDEAGCPTFLKEKVRRNKFYFNVNINESWSN